MPRPSSTRATPPAVATSWRTLYRVGAWAALFTAAMTVAGVVTFLLWPPPTDGLVPTWFALFNESPLEGMLGMDLVVLFAYLSNIAVFLALCVALRRTNVSLVTLGGAIAAVSIITYFASSRIFEMLALSRQYALAATDAERALFAAAGQSMLTTYLGSFAAPTAAGGWNYQGTAFNLSFVLAAVAGILLSTLMMRSPTFGRFAAIMGIVGNLTALGIFLPGVGIWLSLLSLPLLLVWYALIARGLLRERL